MDGSGLNWFSSCHQISFFLCQLVLNSCYLPWCASGVCFCSHVIAITFYPEISLKNFAELQPWPEAFGSTFRTPRSGGPPWICSPSLLSHVSRIYHEHIHSYTATIKVLVGPLVPRSSFLWQLLSLPAKEELLTMFTVELLLFVLLTGSQISAPSFYILLCGWCIHTGKP